MPRHLRPRPPVATTPICVSQFTAPALFGFKTEASFLAFVNASNVRNTRIGKTVMVDVDDLRAALRDRATSDDQPIAEVVAGDEQPQTEDAVLARIGMRRCG